MTDAATRFGHQAALYESGDRGASMLRPVLEEGIGRSVPTILKVDRDLEDAVDRVLGERSASIIKLNPTSSRRPMAALQRELNLYRRLLVRGAPEVKMVAAVPHGDADWSGWVRFESAANHFFADLPVTRICVYDLRTTPRDVVDDVMATHPWAVDGDGTTQRNPSYVEPEALLPDRAAREVDPLEETKPTVELMNASTDQARAAVETVARDVPLRRQDVSALCVAADEAITNARQHGEGTVTTRIWRGPNRVAVAVSDEGTGPASPFAGMLAGAGRQGMWLLHQLCTRVSTTRGPEGFTVHMVAQANVPRRG
jgi:anti-sigma regulatory factor (Ser/Thr protein kinase)